MVVSSSSKSSNGKSPATTVEEGSSSSSSNDSSGSTPNTPPSPIVQPHTPIPVAVPPQTSRYSPNTTARSTPKSTASKSRLGAIDEDSDAVSPDVPLKNPLRRLGLHPVKFSLLPIPTLHAIRRPPKNIYDDVEGPRGEKFTDLRQNKRSATPRRWGWRTLVCLGCIVLIIGAALAIGLIVGFKVKHNKDSKQQNSSSNSTNPSNTGTSAGFPAGQYSISSYLNDIDTSCTSYSSTWNCYPSVTYNQSVSASFSTLNWNIAKQSDGRYTISSADTTFSYPFQNVLLTRYENGTADEYWMFNTRFDKVVIPSTALTSDGTTSKCFFNNTLLTGKLYTKKSKAQALQNATASTGGTSNSYQPWLYALDFEESVNSGTGIPDCYAYVNGQLGRNLGLESTLSSNGLRTGCECQYTNYFPVS